MNKTIRLICPGLVGFLLAVTTTRINAQAKPDPETMERLVSFWSLTMEQVRVEAGADSKEFGVYNRFYAHQIDSMQSEFSQGVFNGTLTLSTVKNYMAQKKTVLKGLFDKFYKIEKEFPTSVDEYRSKKIFRMGADSCFPACYNTGFQDGTFDGWYGYYAINNSTTTGFVLSTPVGGYLGAVSRAAQDPNTGNSYQLHITSGTATDWFLDNYSTYSMSQVSPYGGSGHSAMIGDSVGNGQGVAILSQSFQVTSTTASITYQYSTFLENPVPPHNYYQQPFFLVAVLDQNGDTIPGCGTYNKNALYASQSGFIGIPYAPNADSIFWRNWSLVNVPLKGYQGQCVTVIFEVLDCALGGHCGYAYVDATCTEENVIASSPAFCGQDSISLTAPPGWGAYHWYGNPSDGIISNDTLQTIYVDTMGTYNVILTSYAGTQCSDTLQIMIDSAPGPVPVPSFHATTACAGQPVYFTNTSTPINGTFYWDFYNIGTYQDTNIVNPSWVYSAAGTYVVKLYEVNNGCGAYVYDTITVLPSVNASFTYSGNTCAPTVVDFTGLPIGAASYSWNFGDTAAAPGDTSNQEGYLYIYDNPGTYTVTLVVSNGGGCPDTVRQIVIVPGPPVASIFGGDSVCAGGVDTLTASGGTTYLWSNGQTNSSIGISITGVTTFTVTATTACGSDTAIFTVNLSAPPIASLVANRDTICPRDTVILTAGGGASYTWSTGATGSSISVNPASTTTYTVHVFSPGTTCTDTASITIDVTPSITSTITATPDTICSGNSTTLSVNSSSGGTNYIWNNGSTTSSITVSPSTTTTYFVAVSGYCTNDTAFQTVTILPSPKPIIAGADSVCSGSGDVLTVTGGTTYLWSTGQTTSTINVSTVGTSTYTVTAYNGCDSHDTTFTVNISPTPIALLNANNNSICSGDTVLLTAGGGTTYLWNDGETVTSRTVVLSLTTTYTLYVSNGYGCMDSAVTTVTVTPSITSTISASTNSICSGGSVTLTVTSNGGPPNYSWNTGSTASSITVNPLTTTTYYVLTTGTCSNDSIGEVITVVPTPSVTISYPDTACMGAATVVTASGATNYLWSTGSTSNPITVNLTGDSTIYVVGSNGTCTDTARKTIHVYPALVKNYLPPDTICAGGLVTIGVSVSGGHPSYTYAWSNGITADSAGPITVTVPPDKYICTITDACGEVVVDTVHILIRPAPTVSFYPTPDTVLGGGFINFINLTTGATGYLWNLGNGTTVSDSAPYYEYNQAGVYQVTLTVTNSYGCTDTLSKDVYVLEKIVLPNVFTPNGDGVNDVFQVTLSGMKSFDIQIFDRWGAKVFESESPNISWTGRSTSGELESSGTYYYVIEATDYKGTNYNKDGFVQLIR